MPKRPILVVVILLFAITPLAWSMQSEQGKQAFDFARDFIESLRSIKEGILEAESASSVKYSNEIVKNINLVKSYQQQNEKIRVAQGYIYAYRNTKDNLIKTITDNALISYGLEIQLNNKMIDLLRGLSTLSVMGGSQGSIKNECMKKISELQAAKNNTYVILIDAAKVVPGVLVSKIPGDQGVMNYLVITTNQRTELIKKLKDVFGDKLYKDIDVKQLQSENVDACGNVLYKFLSMPYKTVDERPSGFKGKE